MLLMGHLKYVHYVVNEKQPAVSSLDKKLAVTSTRYYIQILLAHRTQLNDVYDTTFLMTIGTHCTHKYRQ